MNGIYTVRSSAHIYTLQIPKRRLEWNVKQGRDTDVSKINGYICGWTVLICLLVVLRGRERERPLGRPAGERETRGERLWN